ncbi:hypothetical protein SDC9_147169 [bioreactor metagenome]|uniref:Uncharacterized protein n=1 Tax=bioreactor metagenome TaxID=1076179 RepID=A0A645ED58_9ZZZZ
MLYHLQLIVDQIYSLDSIKPGLLVDGKADTTLTVDTHNIVGMSVFKLHRGQFT